MVGVNMIVVVMVVVIGAAAAGMVIVVQVAASWVVVGPVMIIVVVVVVAVVDAIGGGCAVALAHVLLVADRQLLALVAGQLDAFAHVDGDGAFVATFAQQWVNGLHAVPACKRTRCEMNLDNKGSFCLSPWRTSSLLWLFQWGSKRDLVIWQS